MPKAFLTRVLATTALTTCLGLASIAQAAVNEIVVTAQKRESTLQDTSISIAVFDSDQLVKSGIATAEDLAKFTPNVVMTNNSNISSPELYIRGVGTSSPNASSDISVGFYIDEVYIGRSDALVDFFDMERVEILRGPQGTLYGRNTIGGAINYITKMPGDEVETSLRLNYGSYDYIGVNGRVSGPIDENIKAGLSLNYKEGGGYIDQIGTASTDDLMDKGEISGRATVVVDFSDSVEMVLRADASKVDVTPIAYQAVQGFDNDPGVAALSATALGLWTFGAAPFVPPGLPPELAGTSLFRIPADGSLPSLLDPSVDNLLPVLDGALGPFDLADTFGLLGKSYTTPSDPYDVNHDQSSKQTRDTKGLSATFNVDVSDNLLLTSISSYRERETSLLEDTDGTNFAFAISTNSGDQSQFSQEIRLQNQNNETLDWTIGAYYFKEEFDGTRNISNPDLDLITAALSIPGLLPSGLPPISLVGLGAGDTNAAWAEIQNTSVETESYAAYGQATYRFNDQWSITGGLRYTHDKKKMDFERVCLDNQALASVFAGLTDPDLNPDTISDPDSDPSTFDDPTLVSFLCSGEPWDNNPATRDFPYQLLPITANPSDSWNSLTPMVSVDFTPNEDLLLYAKASKGFKSGGFDAKNDDPAFDPEEVWAYQIGAKATLFDNKLQVNTEAFYYDHKDLQVRTVRTAGGTALRADEITANGGDSEDYGFEVEFIATPAENLTLQGGIGYVHSEYGDFFAKDTLKREIGVLADADGRMTIRNLAGNKLVNTPEWSSSLVAQYDIPTANSGTFSIRGEHIYKDEYYFTEFNDDDLKQDATHLFNARLSWTDPNDRFEVALWGRNLSDELYYVQALDLRDGALGSIIRTPAAPRTYGIEVLANF